MRRGRETEGNGSVVPKKRRSQQRLTTENEKTQVAMII